MGKIEVTVEEWDILLDHKRHGPTVLMREKAEAMLMLAEGAGIDFVARIVGRQPSTVNQWKRDFGECRLASIYDFKLGNLNASKLTVSQREEVMEVLSQPPSPDLVPSGFWTVPALSAWVSDRFEVTYDSDTSLVFLLHQAGLSFHGVEAFDKRRASDDVIEVRMGEIQAELAEDLADPEVIVVAADEVRLEHEAITRRAWYKRGEKTKLKVDRQRQAQSYIGFLDQKTGSVHLEAVEWQNSDTIITALTSFALHHKGHKITIVWDNAGWHKSKKLRHELATNQTLAGIHLINMPPYAPDHNPIEHVWAEAKAQISNLQRDTFEQTRHAFETFITGNTFPYKL